MREEALGWGEVVRRSEVVTDVSLTERGYTNQISRVGLFCYWMLSRASDSAKPPLALTRRTPE